MFRSGRLALSAVAAALSSVLAACGASTAGSEDGVQVVASLYPLEYVVERVAGDLASVTPLTRPGQEAHDLEIGIEQTAAVEDADLVVYERGFQPAVDEAVELAAPQYVVEARASVSTQEGGSAAADPHVWLDPENLLSIAREVQARLREIDPDNGADYERNLERLREDLEQLGEDYRSGLTGCAIDTVVVSHDAFSYLPTPFRFESISGASPDAEPSPARLRELAELIRAKEITTVFSEPLETAELAETLGRELGVNTAVLDPIEGLSDETAEKDYLSLMRENLAALRKANQCS